MQGALLQPFPTLPPAVRFGIDGFISVLSSTSAAQTLTPKIARRALEAKSLRDTSVQKWWRTEVNTKEKP